MIDTIISLLAMIVGFAGGFRLGMVFADQEKRSGKMARDVLGRVKKAQIVDRDKDKDINQVLRHED